MLFPAPGRVGGNSNVTHCCDALHASRSDHTGGCFSIWQIREVSHNECDKKHSHHTGSDCGRDVSEQKKLDNRLKESLSNVWTSKEHSDSPRCLATHWQTIPRNNKWQVYFVTVLKHWWVRFTFHKSDYLGNQGPVSQSKYNWILASWPQWVYHWWW